MSEIEYVLFEDLLAPRLVPARDPAALGRAVLDRMNLSTGRAGHVRFEVRAVRLAWRDRYYVVTTRTYATTSDRAEVAFAVCYTAEDAERLAGARPGWAPAEMGGKSRSRAEGATVIKCFCIAAPAMRAVPAIKPALARRASPAAAACE